ncbi:type I glyceraldehyde-3-phosphate dehydrogenase [Jannaschia ovalis]|uniref:Glyceraldehyde 3-phosphate dehydrogenase NAD-binding domain-containing protein n=1 Tax=Jannaschia ovalis TaxID=3038773 RepID=A0ABY8LHV2_9RHOB|nr:glyceraldehyde 3-phosphate dehydrogenase NAD-binding domain-containing protein [Jannaschia sp. GRR-S6-38]WGH79935.1 glyceraldehyde 3-phosphate dehydrogenase NAD-binding domain-containing protein [Jannaschia sp. GRR-S6-38]
MRVFINGFGRIGRSILRAHLLGAGPQLRVVGINDIAPLESCAYLFRYDSVFGPWAGRVETGEEELLVEGHAIPFHRTPDLRTLKLGGVDLVMECTGRADTRAEVERGLLAGAGKVLMSGPSAVADATVVLGANDAMLQPGHRIVSNASCTTNAVAPLLALLDRAFGLRSGSMTTIHCYTGSQPTVDMPRGGADLARSRAAALSMVPTTTSAGRLVDQVLPALAGRVTCQSVRVPVASVSAVDLAFLPERAATVAEVNAALADAGGVIGSEAEPLVSSDLRGRAESVVMAPAQTRAAEGGMIRVFGWYDNEWGFANRMLDMARRMAG